MAKQKESMDKILNKYDFRTNNIVKQFKQHKIESKVDAKTPRVSDRVLNVKTASHKKSNVNIHSHTNKLYGISNSSFTTDQPDKQSQTYAIERRAALHRLILELLLITYEWGKSPQIKISGTLILNVNPTITEGM